MTAKRSRAILALHLVEGSTWLVALMLGALRFSDIFAPDWFSGEVSQLTAAALLFSAARLRVMQPDTFGVSAMSALAAVGAVVLLFWPGFGASMARAWSWALGVPFLVGWAMYVRGAPRKLWRDGGWAMGGVGLLVWGATFGWVEPVWSLPAPLAQAGFNIRTSGAIERGTPAPFGDHFIGFADGPSPTFCWIERLPAAYGEKDIVSRNGTLYRCLRAHEASLDFGEDAVDHWDLVLRPTARQRESAPNWAPGVPGDCLRPLDQAFGSGMRFSVVWQGRDGEQAIVQLERFQGALAMAAGVVWLILGTFATGIRTFRASLHEYA